MNPRVRKLAKRVASVVPGLKAVLRRNDELQETVRQLSHALAHLNERIASLKPPIGNFFPEPKLAQLDPVQEGIVRDFQRLYYELGQAGQATYVSSWLGFGALKCPLDLWIYQELIFANRPQLIIETGTASGGATLFLAMICQAIDNGRVISIDVEGEVFLPRPQHPRITYIKGSSTDEAVISNVRNIAGPDGVGLVILDSDHHKDHVLQELRLYSGLVPVGGHLVIEDTNINGHPAYPDFGPGPMEALVEFLAENDSFRRQPECERFLLTMNPRGFLRRIK